MACSMFIAAKKTTDRLSETDRQLHEQDLIVSFKQADMRHENEINKEERIRPA